MRPRASGQVGAVGGGDGLHDREAEPVAVGQADALVAEPPEGLEQTLQFDEWDDGSRVADRQPRAVGCGAGRNLHGAIGGVVAHRVVEQVRDQARNKGWVADRVSLVEGRIDLDAAALCVILPAVDDLLREPSEVEWLPGLDAAFAGGERQQRVDQPLLLA